MRQIRAKADAEMAKAHQSGQRALRNPAAALQPLAGFDSAAGNGGLDAALVGAVPLAHNAYKIPLAQTPIKRTLEAASIPLESLA
jgi:hypothetical protein